MNSKSATIITAFYLLWHFNSFAADVTARQIAAELTGRKTVEATWESIPPDYRDEVIAVLRSRAEEGSGKSASILLRLGDEWTVQQYVGVFVDTEGVNWGARYNMLFSASPSVAEALASLMFRDDEYRYYPPVNPEFPGSRGVSYESAGMIRHLLTTIPEVPESTAQWADSLSTIASPELRDTMRRWWEQNREHFESDDLDQLQPLRESEVGETAPSVSAAPQPGRSIRKRRC